MAQSQLHNSGEDGYAERALVLTKTIDRHDVKLYVGITDYDWFKLHTSKESVDEVNFWRPSSTATFKALQWAEPFLFKLHPPRNFIVGGGFFTKFLQLPVSLAWDAFGEANGATSLEEVRTRIAKYRKHSIGPTEDPQMRFRGESSAAKLTRHPTQKAFSFAMLYQLQERGSMGMPAPMPTLGQQKRVLRSGTFTI